MHTPGAPSSVRAGRLRGTRTGRPETTTASRQDTGVGQRAERATVGDRERNDGQRIKRREEWKHSLSFFSNTVMTTGEIRSIGREVVNGSSKRLFLVPTNINTARVKIYFMNPVDLHECIGTKRNMNISFFFISNFVF